MLDIKKSMLKSEKIKNLPKPIKKVLITSTQKILKEKEINKFLQEHSNESALTFIDSVLDNFNISYSTQNREKENIPAIGKVIIIANHPLGAIDSLALIKMVSEVRSDIKIVANELLTKIKPIEDILLGVDNNSNRTSKESIKEIYKALEEEKAVIIFPAGEVSRAGITGIKDKIWNKGFINFAKKSNAPILPIFIDAKNSKFFYTSSAINKPLSAILLPREMFKQNNLQIKFKIGEIIPIENINFKINADENAKLFKKHLYKIAKDKKGVFQTQSSIIHPVNSKELKKELKNSELLGETIDGKKIYLYSTNKSSIVLDEIGRLREFTFRKVGEGSGTKKDIDKYDYYYKHIILFDNEELEIVGAYRIGESNFINKEFGETGFYTNSLFEYKEGFNKYLENSIELGRSFVQPKYWGSRALDYLWQGIGAYLKNYPEVKYLFGPVSLSTAYPITAQTLIIYFYKKYFGNSEELVQSQNRFTVPNDKITELESLFNKDYKEDLLSLKKYLSMMDMTIPTLYKQYSELCEEGGVQFLDFGIDRDFNDCVDGFILVDVTKLKPKKKARYLKK
jgi:putative hemolysin